MGIRDRLESLSRAELAGLVAVVVLTLAGAGLWYARSLPRPVALAELPGPSASPGVAGSHATAVGSPAPTAAGTVIVDVTGEVRRPGVYAFPSGARVVDAIERAGGPTGRAFLPALNLAATLVDGQQVLVPREGDQGAPGAGPAAPGAPGAAGPLVNVNTADAAALETLPGIGEVLAGAIIQYRTEHGPFRSVDELEDVSGIGPATLEKLRPLVTV
ncbi:MAG: competence protein ComEA [Actinomycetota bacterium]|nr:MAG: competence protein ComEA [Actinomycetota bacterium]